MIFTPKTNNQLVIKSVMEANELKIKIVNELSNMDKKFLSSNIDSKKLAELIDKDDSVMEVHTYYYWRSGVLGMFDARYPNRIYVNTNSLPRSIPSLVGTNWHEAIHLLDSKDSENFFHHGNNRYAAWKDNTAPYFVGNLAFKLSNGDNLEYDPTEANDIVTYVPWWKRILRRIF